MIKSKRTIVILISLLLVLSQTSIFAEEPTKDPFEGVWIRKPLESQNFDPFAPDFLIIDRIDSNYLVIVVNSIVENDRLLAESTHHIYRPVGATLVCSGVRLSLTSTLRLIPNGKLVEVIDIPEISESGENIYLRPKLNDFTSMIEWYGYKLNGR